MPLLSAPPRKPAVASPPRAPARLAPAAPIASLPASASVYDPRVLALDHALRGDRLHAQNEFAAAVDAYRCAVSLFPGDARCHYMLATAAARCSQPQYVEPHLREALRLKPDAPIVHQALAQCYITQERVEQALRHSEQALAMMPCDPNYVIVHALVLERADRAEEAWQLVRPLIAAGSNHPALLDLYGSIAHKFGQEQHAISYLGRALSSPELWADRSAYVNIQFVLGEIHDRLGQYERAFAHFRAGNESNKLIRAPHDPASHAQRVSNVIRHFTPRRLRSLPRAMHDDHRPVFIVGMARSGTSLVEQILASHPAGFGAGELDTLSRIAMSESSTTPDSLPWDDLTIRNAGELAARYLAHIDTLESGDAQYVTDKMPENFLRLDAVEVLFPNAKVIHCVRDPLDTCLSCYATNFENGHHHTLDLAHLGAYYADYRRLMDHWKRVLSVPILDVRYEDLVLAPQPNVTRLLEFLGLPWDDRCMRFHENKRRVRTASREQIRRPLYTSSIGRWKNYQPFLGELIEQLSRSASSRTAAAA